MPKVSVVVPVYKVEEYLPRCVESLLGQTLQDIEIILVDDGSPDGCSNLVDQYARADARIKVIHKKNAGVSAARNDGFRLAEGAYTYFVDSDDWLVPNALELLHSKAIETKSDIVISDYIASNGIEEKRYEICSNEFVTEEKESIEALQLAVFNMGPAYYKASSFIAKRGIGAAWHHLIRTDLIRGNGCEFDTALGGLFDDGLFVLNVLEHANRVSYVQRPTYYYRTVAESITRAFREAPFLKYQNVYNKLDEFICINNKDNRFIEALNLRKYIYLNKSMSTYFMHPANPKKESERYSEFVSIAKSEPYVSAISGFDKKQLGCAKSKILVFLLRAHLYKAFWVCKKANS